jgi:ankyrin repeat protein
MELDQYTLHEAAKARNITLICEMLKNGVNQNQKDKDGRTPLHYAVLSQPKPTAAYAGTEVDHISVPMSPVRQSAVSSFHTSGPTLKEIKTTSHREVQRGHPYSAATSRLTSRFTSQFRPPKATATPIKDSDELFQDQAIEVVVPSPTEIDLLSDDEPILTPKTYHEENKGYTPSQLVAQSDSSDRVKDSDELFQDQAIEAVVPSPTELGLLSGDRPILAPKTYYEENKGYTPSQLAAQSDSSDCVYLLLRNGTNVDANIQDNDGRTPLHLAAQLDSSNCVYSLLTNGANVDANIQDNDGRTPLHLAAQLDSSNCVYSLLTNGANVDANIQDNDGRTPLHLAAQLDSSNCVYSLLGNGTNVDANIQDNDGRTPLHLAAQLDSSNCIYSLLRNGTNVDANIQDNDGRTPLHLAARLDSSNCVYSLLRNGTNVDVNIQDKEGCTPFQAVAFSDWEDLVLKLLEHGADPPNIKRWWHSRQDSSTEKEVPGYLKLWENAANGFDYGTIGALVKDILMAEEHTTFGSIVWEWELPAVLDLSDPARVNGGEAQWLDPTQHVVLVKNESSTDYTEKPAKWVQATTCAEYLAQRWKTEWCGFVLGLLDLVKLAGLGSENSGTLFDFRVYLLPL